MCVCTCVKRLKCVLCKIRAHLQFSMHVLIHVYKSTLILTNYKTSFENIYFKGKHNAILILKDGRLLS